MTRDKSILTTCCPWQVKVESRNSPNACRQGTLLTLLLCYGAACIPFTYLFSSKTSMSSGFSALVIIGLFVGVVPSIAISAMEESQDEYYENLAMTLKHIFLSLFPQFGLTYNILKFSRKVVQNHNWLVMSAEKKNSICATKPNPCCNDDTMKCEYFKSYFVNETLGIRNDLWAIPVTWVIYMAIVIFIDSVYAKKVIHFIGVWKDRVDLLVPTTNTDNRSEKRREHKMFADNLYKYFSGKKVVENVSLNVRQGKCLGLLGVNGAGKTTTFKMLTNEEIFDYGEVGIQDGENKINIKSDKYFQKISYCPQYDALNDVLSAKEQLKFIAMVKRLHGADIEELTDKFLDILELTPYKDVPSGDLSGGNKRKLALGMALIGDHKYTLLDEPTSGVDPISRRKIWTIIDAWKMNKKAAFVLTSHSMDECEALCDDIAIMKKGRINAKGTIPKLKEDHNKGFTLKMKLKATFSDAPEMKNVKENTFGRSNSWSRFDHNGLEERNQVISTLDSIVKDTLLLHAGDQSNVEIMEYHDRMLQYHIKSKRNWSEMFDRIEKLKEGYSHIIEDYTLSGTSLEDVFLSVAQATENERESDSSKANGTHKNDHENLWNRLFNKKISRQNNRSGYQ